MRRLVESYNAQRALMGAAFALNFWNLHDAQGLLRYFVVTALVMLAAAQVMIERSRRDLKRNREAWAWHFAALDADPMASMAQAAFLARLSLHEVRALAEWHMAHPAHTDSDLDDAPPLVRDYYAARNAPRES
jgi:hypothetical protein